MKRSASNVAEGNPSPDDQSSTRVRRRARIGDPLVGLLIVAVALIVRLVYLYEIRSVAFFDQPVGDARGYYDWARRIAAAQSFREWLGDTSFYQAPLYPYVLALWFKTAGDGFLGIRIFQAVLGSLAAGCLSVAAARMFGRPTGWIAGLMFALYAPAVFFDGLIQKASLGAFLLCAMLASMTYLTRDRRAWPATLTGAMLALLILTRENAMIWMPFVAVWALWGGRTRGLLSAGSFFAGWPALAALVGGTLVILLPVGLRNLAVGGQWSISTFQAGPNFYIGNSLHADGRYRPLRAGHETPQFERRDATELAQRDLGKTLSPREVSRYWMKRAFDDIRSSPIRWVKLMARKGLMVLNAYEVADVESQVVYADQSTLLTVLSRVWHFGVLAPVACAGVILTWRRRRVLWIHYALVITMAAAIALFYVLGRYRYPLAPLLIPFAAVAVARGAKTLRRRNYRTLRSPAVAALLCFTCCSLLPVHPTGRLNASAYMNLGVAYVQRNNPGDFERATACFVRTVKGNPDSPQAHYNLALALVHSNDIEGAIRHYEAALALVPTLMHADYNLAVALEQTGRTDEALGHYERALELDANDADAAAAVARLKGH